MRSRRRVLFERSVPVGSMVTVAGMLSGFHLQAFSWGVGGRLLLRPVGRSEAMCPVSTARPAMTLGGQRSTVPLSHFRNEVNAQDIEAVALLYQRYFDNMWLLHNRIEAFERFLRNTRERYGVDLVEMATEYDPRELELEHAPPFDDSTPEAEPPLHTLRTVTSIPLFYWEMILSVLPAAILTEYKRFAGMGPVTEDLPPAGEPTASVNVEHEIPQHEEQGLGNLLLLTTASLLDLRHAIQRLVVMPASATLQLPISQLVLAAYPHIRHVAGLSRSERLELMFVAHPRQASPEPHTACPDVTSEIETLNRMFRFNFNSPENGAQP